MILKLGNRIVYHKPSHFYFPFFFMTTLFKGFSLMELIIVLVIVGILLNFAYPSYQAYLARAHRLEGQIALFDLADKMELHYQKYGSYARASIGTGTIYDVLSTAKTLEGWYELAIIASNEHHFILQATPTEVQARQDHWCQSLRLNDLGEESIASGPNGTPEITWKECWS
ncbi:MAG TPA: type IV pilin protein [Legionellaceae bacterium]|nr:type IV pilin protein [Legionellaceae bacterium]